MCNFLSHLFLVRHKPYQNSFSICIHLMKVCSVILMSEKCICTLVKKLCTLNNSEKNTVCVDRQLFVWMCTPPQKIPNGKVSISEYCLCMPCTVPSTLTYLGFQRRWLYWGLNCKFIYACYTSHIYNTIMEVTLLLHVALHAFIPYTVCSLCSNISVSHVLLTICSFSNLLLYSFLD